MWANAQRDGRPAERRWRFSGVPQTNGSISAASEPKFTILWRHVEDIWLQVSDLHLKFELR